ncbi:IS3 family transposase [Leptospirillum ferrooxidans]|uniref:IS3 family transposase n=1 Tax=Leptospirillum ferrooxidans TaxID=180 RepID=UPI0011D2B4C8|nr:IS3 family transposase [Leptospirillum ferrooxidans]
MLDSDCPELPLSTQSKLLSVSRSGLYYRAVLPSPEEISLRHRIDEITTRWPFFGSRRIAASLKREGLIVGRERVQTFMREMGIEGIHPGPNLSKRALSHKVYPYLLRNITAQYPHHIWGVDITYIRLAHGLMYLVAIIDWHSRYVVSWELDQTLEMPFVLDYVDRAFSTALPAIFNSDQGSRFTSNSYIERLLSRNIQISMDGKGRAIESLPFFQRSPFFLLIIRDIFWS